MTWYYSVNCSASSFDFLNPSWTDDKVTISGNYEPITGASLVGASVYLELQTPSSTTIIIPVQEDGHWSQNITYSGSSLVWPATLLFTGSSVPCTFQTNILWQVKEPSCTNVGVFTATPQDPTIDQPVTVSIQSMDALSSPLPNVSWLLYSQTQGEQEWSFSGVTDENGQATVVIGNGGFGMGVNTLVLALDNGSQYSCSTTTEVNWVNSP